MKIFREVKKYFGNFQELFMKIVRILKIISENLENYFMKKF